MSITSIVVNVISVLILLFWIVVDIVKKKRAAKVASADEQSDISDHADK